MLERNLIRLLLLFRLLHHENMVHVGFISVCTTLTFLLVEYFQIRKRGHVFHINCRKGFVIALSGSLHRRLSLVGISNFVKVVPCLHFTVCEKPCEMNDSVGKQNYVSCYKKAVLLTVISL